MGISEKQKELRNQLNAVAAQLDGLAETVNSIVWQLQLEFESADRKLRDADVKRVNDTREAFVRGAK